MKKKDKEEQKSCLYLILGAAFSILYIVIVIVCFTTYSVNFLVCILAPLILLFLIIFYKININEDYNNISEDKILKFFKEIANNPSTLMVVLSIFIITYLFFMNWFKVIGAVLIVLPFACWLFYLREQLSYLKNDYKRLIQETLRLYENIDEIESWVKELRRKRYETNIIEKYTLEDTPLYLFDPRRKKGRIRISISEKDDYTSEIIEWKEKELRDYLNSSK